MSKEKKLTLGEVFTIERAAAERRFMHTARDWADLTPTEQASVQAGANAVAAHVVNPAAEDYDHAAEFIRLRDALTGILDEFGLTGSHLTARVSKEHYFRLRALIAESWRPAEADALADGAL